MLEETVDSESIDIDDDEIIIELIDHKEDGLRKLLKKYGHIVSGYLMKKYGRVISDADIDAILYEAAFKTFQSISTYDDRKGKISTWFTRIAVNAAIDFLRQEKRSHNINLPSELQSGIVPTPISPERQKVLSDMKKIIEKLPPMQRTIIEADLAAGGTASAEFLANKFGNTQNSIFVSRNKAHKKIKEELESLGHYF